MALLTDAIGNVQRRWIQKQLEIKPPLGLVGKVLLDNPIQTHAECHHEPQLMWHLLWSGDLLVKLPELSNFPSSGKVRLDPGL